MFLCTVTMHILRKKDNGLAAVARELGEIKQAADIEHLLHELLTPAECRDLALRWDVLRLLKAGHSQRSIAEELGVSLCKVTRGARVLKREDSVARRLLEK